MYHAHVGRMSQNLQNSQTFALSCQRFWTKSHKKYPSKRNFSLSIYKYPRNI